MKSLYATQRELDNPQKAQIPLCRVSSIILKVLSTLLKPNSFFCTGLSSPGCQNRDMRSNQIFITVSFLGFFCCWSVVHMSLCVCLYRWVSFYWADFLLACLVSWLISVLGHWDGSDREGSLHTTPLSFLQTLWRKSHIEEQMSMRKRRQYNERSWFSWPCHNHLVAMATRIYV